MTMDLNRILIIRTGGTIDARPYADATAPPPVVRPLDDRRSYVQDFVSSILEYGLEDVALPAPDEVDMFSWMGRANMRRFVKDSQLFTDEDIQALAQLIKSDEGHSRFLITHGTDAMAKNAAALKAALAGTDKVVVFVGAMVPLSMAIIPENPEGDGMAALESGLAKIREQQPGVYMVARDPNTKRLALFDPERVEKDLEASRADLAFTVRSRG